MARRKKKKLVISKKYCFLVTTIVVTIGLLMLVLNRTKPVELEYSIKFLQGSAEIFIGEITQIGYTITNSNGDDKLIWTTSNSNIATVDSKGRIKGISFGDVVITVSLPNGSESSVNVRVKSYPVYLRVETDIKPSHNWFNSQVGVTISVLNISEVKYCLTHDEECVPTTNYTKKIVLKDGVWYLYIKGIDKNGKEVSHREIFNVDFVAPKCSITRIGKLNEETATIQVICEKDASGIDRYEWYRDGTMAHLTTDNQIYANKIYSDGKHKYSVKVYDVAGNARTYQIDN